MRALGLASLLASLLGCAPTPTTVSSPRAPAPTRSRFEPAPPGERALVLWTASVQGYVEPCGCTADPLGGVARLAAAIDEARRAYRGRVLFLDGGDLLFERLEDQLPTDGCQAEARADQLVDRYARAGLAGTVLGPLDDVRGATFRDARLAKAGIATVGFGAPRGLGDGARALPRLLVDAGGVKVGVTAFRADLPTDVPAARDSLARETQALQDEGARAVVAIAQAPRELTRAIARGLPGLDAVLQGRAPGEAPLDAERLVDERGIGPVLLAAGMQAQHLGALELVLDGRARQAPLPLDDRAALDVARGRLLEIKRQGLEGEIGRELDAPRRAFLEERLASVRAELTHLQARAAAPAQPLVGPHQRAWSLPLTRGSAEEPAAAAALASYRASIPALVERCEANTECTPAPVGTASFVGVAVCRACHAQAVSFWQQQAVTRPGKDESGRVIERVVGHARAWQTLVEDQKERDRSCVPCHAVGFGEPGGPCKTSDVVKGGFAGVQCESCHGAGSIHASMATRESIVRAPDEQRCRACHRVPHIETTGSFVFEERRRLIVGPGHGLPPIESPASPTPAKETPR